MVASASHDIADIGATSLLRHPEPWRESMLRFGELPSRPPLRMAIALEWVMPYTTHQAEERIEKARKNMPAVAYSLATDSASTA